MKGWWPYLIGFAVAGTVCSAVTNQIQHDKIDRQQGVIEFQQRQIDQNKRQIAQLNGRVFLGTDIPDTESGKQ